MQVMVVPISAVIGMDKLGGREKYALTVFQPGKATPVELYDTMDAAREARDHFAMCLEIAEIHGFRFAGECFVDAAGRQVSVAETLGIVIGGAYDSPFELGKILMKVKNAPISF